MQEDRPLRAALYCRISETDDEFDKVENQLSILRPFCTKNNYDLVAEYCDDGVSAWRDDVTRPEWQRLLGDISKGMFDVIVATFENRLTRQLGEKVELLGLCKASGVSWHTVHDGPVDPTSSDAQLLTVIKGWQAQTEISSRSKAQRQRFDAERAAGNPLWGVRPFGFQKDRKTHHPTESAEVRWAYAQVLEGKTLYSIGKDWNARGITTSRGKTWSYATIHQLLRREANVAKWNGQRMSWEPLVDEDTFNAVQALLKRPERAVSRVREPRWLLAGIATCGTCGAPLRSAKGSDRKATYPVYRCSSTTTTPGPSAPIIGEDGKRKRHGSVKCDELDKRVRSEVAAAFLFAPRDFLPGTADDFSDLQRAHAELASIRKSLEEVAEAVGDPDFPVAVLKKKAATLRQQEAALTDQIDEIASRSAQSAMLLHTTREFLSGPRVSIDDAADRKAELEAQFASLPLHHQRTLVKALLDVQVETGRTPARLKITHKIAVSLNPEGELG